MFSFHRHTVLLALLALVMLFGMTGSTIAQEATPGAGEVTILPPDESYGGAARGEWDARWWQWVVSMPPILNPNFNAADALCNYGQWGPVFFLPANFSEEPSQQTCIVPEGTAIFVPIVGTECSSVESPPFFGRDEAELRACAMAATDRVSGLQVSVDGQAVPNLESYRTSSPLFTMHFLPQPFSEGNSFAFPDGVALAASDGYSLIIAPPPPGEYEMKFSATVEGEDGVLFDSTIHLIVEAAQVIEPPTMPDASPEAATPVA